MHAVILLLGASGYEGRNHPALFHQSTEVEPIDWLQSGMGPAGTALASCDTGRYMPARIGHGVFMGRSVETVGVNLKRQLATAFFQASSTDNLRLDLPCEYGICCAYHRSGESALGGCDPSRSQYLDPAHSGRDVCMCRVAG